MKHLSPSQSKNLLWLKLFLWTLLGTMLFKASIELWGKKDTVTLQIESGQNQISLTTS